MRKNYHFHLFARLNLSYNAISNFGSVSNYPLTLKHLDLGYNQIDNWPGDVISSALVQHHGYGGSLDNLCYAEILNCDFSASLSVKARESGGGDGKRLVCINKCCHVILYVIDLCTLEPSPPAFPNFNLPFSSARSRPLPPPRRR
jgi:hypothetical protein